MRLLLFIKHLFVTVLLSPAFYTNAQSIESDSLSYAKSVQHAVDLYHQFMNDEKSLYNGSQYLIYTQTIQEGIPFFETTEFVKGDVTYNGILYENVPLVYDILKEELITRIPTNNYTVMLVNDKVSSFALLNHKFVRLVKDSTDKIIKTGFAGATN